MINPIELVWRQVKSFDAHPIFKEGIEIVWWETLSQYIDKEY